jgi:hypothetical protein
LVKEEIKGGLEMVKAISMHSMGVANAGINAKVSVTSRDRKHKNLTGEELAGGKKFLIQEPMQRPFNKKIS